MIIILIAAAWIYCFCVFVGWIRKGFRTRMIGDEATNISVGNLRYTDAKGRRMATPVFVPERILREREALEAKRKADEEAAIAARNASVAAALRDANGQLKVLKGGKD